MCFCSRAILLLLDWRKAKHGTTYREIVRHYFPHCRWRTCVQRLPVRRRRRPNATLISLELVICLHFACNVQDALPFRIENLCSAVRCVLCVNEKRPRYSRCNSSAGPSERETGAHQGEGAQQQAQPDKLMMRERWGAEEVESKMEHCERRRFLSSSRLRSVPVRRSKTDRLPHQNQNNSFLCDVRLCRPCFSPLPLSEEARSIRRKTLPLLPHTEPAAAKSTYYVLCEFDQIKRQHEIPYSTRNFASTSTPKYPGPTGIKRMWREISISGKLLKMFPISTHTHTATRIDAQAHPRNATRWLNTSYHNS